jgi:hypothetical protein
MTKNSFALVPGEDFTIDERTGSASLSDQGKGTTMKGMFQNRLINKVIVALAGNPGLQESLINSYFDEVTKTVNSQLEGYESRQRIMDSIAARKAAESNDPLKDLIISITFPEPNFDELVEEQSTEPNEQEEMVINNNDSYRVSAV